MSFLIGVTTWCLTKRLGVLQAYLVLYGGEHLLEPSIVVEQVGMGPD